ncbi:Protein clueless [Dirofilaria immitis]
MSSTDIVGDLIATRSLWTIFFKNVKFNWSMPNSVIPSSCSTICILQITNVLFQRNNIHLNVSLPSSSHQFQSASSPVDRKSNGSSITIIRRCFTNRWRL